MASWIRSLLFAAVFYSGSAVFVLALLIVFPFASSSAVPIGRGWSRFHRRCCRWLLGQRLRIVGEMPDGPYLYAFKHESMYETIEMPRLFARPAVMAKRELLDIPFWGRAGRAYGLVPVEREAGPKAMRAMLAAAKLATDAGRPIVLFPEGTRVAHGQSPELRSGFAGLYKLLKLPVIPVAIDSGRVSPKGRFVKDSGTITMLVGETIPPGLDRDVAEARVHSAINALNRPG